MKCLVVTAHPLPESLCNALAEEVVRCLSANHHDVAIKDLYAEEFSPLLTVAERQTYYNLPYDASSVKNDVDQLLGSEALVLVFPTWWFSLPAILKGWFDRVWGPGIAYDHADDYGPIRPRLDRLKHMLVVTTLGAPWWVDHLVLWQPVKRVLKKAILGACAPRCRFNLLTLYKSEKIDSAQYQRFCQRIRRILARWQ